MLPYGILYVFGVQVSLLTALTTCSPVYVSVGCNLLFFLSIGWGMVLLGEFPTIPQLFGIGFIGLSIISSTREIIVTTKQALNKEDSLGEEADEEDKRALLLRMFSTEGGIVNVKRGNLMKDLNAALQTLEEEERRGAIMLSSGIEDEEFSEKDRPMLQKWKGVLFDT